MFNAFSTALSALKANSTAIDVVGNNLANLNTTAFKASNVMFYDMVTEAIGSVNQQSGLGTAPPQINPVYSQGAIQSSNGNLDAAIQGDGFFVTRDDNGAQLFTRNGSFKVNSDGNVLTGDGQHVQGWGAITGTPDTNGPAGDIVLPGSALRQPFATTKYKIEMNLDASAADGTPFSTPMEVWDSLGNKHVLTATFTKNGANTWDYNVDMKGEELTAGTAGTPSSLASGSFGFDSTGKLVLPAPPPTGAENIPLDITGLADGAADLTVNWNIFDGSGQSFISQFAQASATSSNSQDGSPAAQLTKFVMNNDGKITAEYSNSQSRVVAQLAVAGIRNPDTLISVGYGALRASALTSLPSVGVAGTGNRGAVVGGALESSTVDIAREFTNLIVLQRSYEANAKIITTADQLSQATINLKQG